MTAAHLYELTAAHRQLQALAEDDATDPQALADTIEGLEGDIMAKAESVAMVIQNLESVASAIEHAARNQLGRAQTIYGRADNLRMYLLVHLRAVGIKKVPREHFVISIRNNPPRVDVVDFAAVPDAFKRWPEPPPPVVDKAKVLEARASGADVPGVSIVQDQRLDIR